MPNTERREYSGHDPRDMDCEYDTWDDVAFVDGARCPICSRRPAGEVGGWNSSDHDDQCESEFIEGPYAYSPCGCKDRVADQRGAEGVGRG